MDPELYKAVVSGNLRHIELLSTADMHKLLQVTTDQKNTILHVAAKYGAIPIAEKIINSCQTLLHETNSKGDSPLHIASRLGNQEMVKLLVDRALAIEFEAEKKLLRVENLNGDTASHEAVRYGKLKVVELLVGYDEQLASFVNKAGESPLFLAVDRQYYVIAQCILVAAPNCSYGGRNGMNVLHAAIIRGEKAEVIRIFENIQDPNSVLPLWNQYTTRKDYKPNEPLYTLVINHLSKAKNFDAVEDIMHRIKLDKNNCRLSNDFFYNVIKIYGQLAGRIRKAIDTLFDMPKGYNCWPNVKTFNLVLNLLVSARIFDVVHEIYVKAPVLGVEIDACCLNILIKGLCENGDLEGAFQVLDEFPKQRCKPNVRTFSTLMHYLCAKGDVDKAFGLLERMEIEEIEVDTITYNILISGLRKQGRIDEGIELLREMKMKGNEPNAGSYQEVLYGLLDVGRLVEAKELIGRMVREGNSPGFVSYKKLIDGLCKGKLIKDIDWALKQMLRQGFVPKMGMWKQIVGCVVSESNASSSIYISQIIGG